MRVEIDGIAYVPQTSIERAEQPAVDTAIRELVVGLHLYGTNLGRGWNGCIYNALRALAPNLMDIYDATGDASALSEIIRAFPKEDEHGLRVNDEP